MQGLHSSTQTSIGETGVNPLYVAYGFLEWQETRKSPRVFHAPLLLQQVLITRETIRRRYRYSIQWAGDHGETNVTLKRRLENDFNLLLPDFLEEDTPEAYLAAVEDLIDEQPGWGLWWLAARLA